jgi:DNA-binding NarL/FixJ family response regulator
MVARGMTNREIAAELVISERAGEAHVEYIRRKLNASSRGQVAVGAAVHGMIGTTPHTS